MEIERKFLLEEALVLNILSQKNVKIFLTQIAQFYTTISKLNEVRYRKTGDEYLLTNKVGEGLARDEFEVVISKTEFKKAKKKRLSSIIEKSRYSFEIDGLNYFLDVYTGNLAPIVTLEVEFSTIQEAMSFKLEDIFGDLHYKDVTEEPRYKNKYLSLFGNPEFEFDAQKAIDVQIKKPDLKLNFPAYISAYDGIRVLLNKFYADIKINKESFLQSGDTEALHQFRVGLRKSRSILHLSKELYDENICKTLCDSLKNIANETNEKRDLDVFIEYLESVNGTRVLIHNLLEINQNHENSIRELIFCKSSEEFFADYEIFLDDKTKFFASKNCDIIFKKFIAKIIREYVVKLERRLKSLDDDSLNDEFHQVRIYFKRLRYVLDSTSDMFDIRVLQKCTKYSKSMQELFGELQDRDVWRQILEIYKQTLYNDSQMYELTSKLDLNISKQLFELRNEILERKDEFLIILNSFSKTLKAYY